MKRFYLSLLLSLMAISSLLAGIDHYSIALKLYRQNTDSAVYHINKGIELTVNRDTLAKLYYLKAYISTDPVDKIKNFRFSLLQYQETGNNKGQFNCLSNVGKVLNENKLTEQAKYFFRLALSEKNIPNDLKVYGFHNLGLSYQIEHNLDSSTYYFQKALYITDSANFVMKGKILLDIAYAYTRELRYDSAIVYYRKIISLPNIGSITNRAYNDLGWILMTKNKIKESKSVFLKAIKNQPENELLVASLANLAKCMTQEGNYDSAYAMYEKALTLDAHTQVWLQCADYMLSYYLTNNELKKARALSKQLNMVAQEIYMRNQNINLQTNQLKINQYFYQNKLEAQREEQRQRIVYVTLGLVILVGAFAIFYMRRRYRKASYMS